MHEVHTDDQLLTDVETARLLGLAVQTLRDWRSTGRVDLPYIRLGRAVRYSRADIRAYCDRHRQTATA